ncbi:hypothetical protein GIB67_003301, partial [Kingdonia uniflora]
MTNKLCRYYAQAVNQDPGVTTDADKVVHAHKMCKRIEKKFFKLPISEMMKQQQITKNDWDRHFLSEQFKEDERIMLTNTDGMDEMMKEFYKTKKEDILVRN